MTSINRRQLIQFSTAASLAGTVRVQASESGSPFIQASTKTVIETESGKVRGFVNRGIWIFRGIPYAEPAGGANRFLPPVKAKPWPGVRSCLTYGPGCPSGINISENGDNSARSDEDNFLLYRTGGWHRGEDCLRLNVCSPGPTPSGRKRPVMVFMHGGGYTGGSGNDLLSYDGENLARNHDVVVVTHNHRLNVFGFLNLAEIGGERFAASGNVGMLDNAAVLEWVRDNIANFGGDPGNVMIFGQSGGGGKVSHLMAMPAAKGLFHRAAVESGATLRSGDPEAAAKIAAALLEELSIPKSQFEKVQTVSTATLVAAQAAALRRVNNGRPGGGWGPIVDGKVIPAHPFDPTAPAISQQVPLLIGTCLNEFVNGVDNPEVDTLTEGELLKRVTQKYGDKSQSIVAAYRKEYPKESPLGYGPRSRLLNRGRTRRPRQSERPLRAAPRRISIFTPGARPCWMDAQELSIAVRSPLCSTTPNSVRVTQAEALRGASFLPPWERPGPVSRGPASQATPVFPTGRPIRPNNERRWSLTTLAQSRTIRKGSVLDSCAKAKVSRPRGARTAEFSGFVC
jgi:para-nitrobenzyl esterase